MIYNFSPLKQKAKAVEEWLGKEFSSVRTGRAAPAILDAVRVEAYGNKMAIRELASIAVEDPRTIRISPWDKSQGKEIERAIALSNLGLSVSVDDAGLRVLFPELTEERRSALVKVAKQKLEEARISLRKEREEVWGDIQREEKDGILSEDDKFRGKDEMQKIIDDANKNLEALFERKEKEIME